MNKEITFETIACLNNIITHFVMRKRNGEPEIWFAVLGFHNNSTIFFIS